MKIQFILALLLMKSCEVSDERLKIENKSPGVVYFIYSKGYTLNSVERVTLVKDPTAQAGDTSYVNYLAPQSQTDVNAPFTWEGFVNNTPGEKINFYFFPVDTLSKYTWEQIMAGNRYSGMLSYTIEDLEKMNWTITYPAKNYEAPTKNLESGKGNWLNNKSSVPFEASM